MQPLDEQFDLETPNNLRFGRGTVSETGRYAARLGDDALVVTDPGIEAAGLLDPVRDSLSDAGVSFEVFDGVQPDPVVSNALDCARAAERIDADSIVGIGGGSSMDVAKTASVLVTNDAPIEELFGRGNVPVAGQPTVLLPTTAGTGSEVSSAAVFFDDRPEGSGEKEALNDEALYADTAIVDPDLTMELPAAITAATGLDAFCHAMGAYMSTDANTFADTLCVEAMSLIEANLRDATYHGAAAPDAREKMALAATMAMMGRVNGGKAAVHSIAYGVQAMYDVPHAEAIAMVLPEVVEYNLPAILDRLAALGERLYDADGSRRERARTTVDGITALRDDLDLDRSLTDVGATDGDMDELADLATHSERHLSVNPRPLEADDAADILAAIW
ncbi:MAG: iron-containing alcohol dehydrogenase [Salinirussus sp.]